MILNKHMLKWVLVIVALLVAFDLGLFAGGQLPPESYMTTFTSRSTQTITHLRAETWIKPGETQRAYYDYRTDTITYRTIITTTMMFQVEGDEGQIRDELRFTTMTTPYTTVTTRYLTWTPSVVTFTVMSNEEQIRTVTQTSKITAPVTSMTLLLFLAIILLVAACSTAFAGRGRNARKRGLNEEDQPSSSGHISGL